MYKQHNFPLFRPKYYFSSVTEQVIIKVAAFELISSQLSFLHVKTLRTLQLHGFTLKRVDTKEPCGAAQHEYARRKHHFRDLY